MRLSYDRGAQESAGGVTRVAKLGRSMLRPYKEEERFRLVAMSAAVSYAWEVEKRGMGGNS